MARRRCPGHAAALAHALHVRVRAQLQVDAVRALDGGLHQVRAHNPQVAAHLVRKRQLAAKGARAREARGHPAGVASHTVADLLLGTVPPLDGQALLHDGDRPGVAPAQQSQRREDSRRAGPHDEQVRPHGRRGRTCLARRRPHPRPCPLPCPRPVPVPCRALPSPAGTRALYLCKRAARAAAGSADGPWRRHGGRAGRAGYPREARRGRMRPQTTQRRRTHATEAQAQAVFRRQAFLHAQLLRAP